MHRTTATLAASLFTLPLLITSEVRAHSSSSEIAGKLIKVDTSRGADKRKLTFKSEKEESLTLLHDPQIVPSALLVRWMSEGGQNAGRTPLIALDQGSWRRAGTSGFKYSDKSYSAGGVKSVSLKLSSGGVTLKLVAKGANLPIALLGPQDSVWLHFMIEEEWFCVEFGGDVLRNADGRYQAKNAPPPVSGCPAQLCGNGIVEIGETCDDGNLVDDDTCGNDCTLGQCDTTEYASTFDAIQAIVFDSYGCNSSVCHSSTLQQGGLDLTPGAAYANLVSVDSATSPGTKRVEPGERDLSVLYDKLYAGTFGGLPTFGGSPMPTVGLPLTENHLEAVGVWIRGGAPADLVVEGTADLLQTCLPEPDPLTIPPPDPPGAGVGAQFRMPPWPLYAEGEDEICVATYYDLTQTNLVPDEAKIPCTIGGQSNPSGECFLWHRQVLAQDPQSHHSIIAVYSGDYDASHPGWGDWTLKFQDPSNPQEGQSCDPTAVDAATGYAPDCSSEAVSTVACIGYGPPDYSALTTTALSGSQQAYYDQEFADGVYVLTPMAGIIVWNSHAFNTTTTDSTMSQYLNLHFAGPADQEAELQRIFNATHIFDANVPPFEQREYCWHHVMPKNSNLFDLSSHTHRFGTLFRIYAPPTAACTNSATCPSGDYPDQLIYQSTEYSDPDQLIFDPPWHFGDIPASERRFRFCSRYDNGSGPSSPPVKQASNPLGSGCGPALRRCMEGPKKGELCGGDHSFCDTSPGAGDDQCDACPAVGGVTTEDEMFILLGAYYLD